MNAEQTAFSMAPRKVSSVSGVGYCCGARLAWAAAAAAFWGSVLSPDWLVNGLGRYSVSILVAGVLPCALLEVP